MDTLTAKPEKDTVCNTSGLPVRRKPEWTDVRFGPDYRANIGVVGSNIVFSQPCGYIKLAGVKKTLDLIDRVISETVPPDQAYILIEDFSKLRGVAFDARRFFINNMRQRKRLGGLVFCSTSALLRLSVKLGKRLYKDDREIRLAKNYPQAVKSALEILSRSIAESKDSAANTADRTDSEQSLTPTYDIIRDEGWCLNLADFTIKMEIIDQKVIHSISTGLLKTEHIEPLVELSQKVQESLNSQSRIEYIVANVTNLEVGDRKARKRYMDSLKERNQDHQLEMYIIYGANRFVQAASNLARPFLPFKIRVADSLDDALNIISKYEIRKKNQSTQSIPTKKRDNAPKGNRIHQYVDELQQFIGIIDWEIDGIDDVRPAAPSHPFFSVFESIALIKGELDELIDERKKAEDALQLANDNLEIRVKERTAELEKANKALRAEIIERKKIETELKNAKLLAESVDKAKSEFVGNMSHELRTPLNHIIGFTELILDKNFGDLSETQEEYLNDVYRSSKQLLSLINDMLDLSKIEARKLKLELSEVNIRMLVKNSLKMVKEKASNHGIKLSSCMDVVSDTLKADKHKLTQVIYNLLSNAVKFSPDGGKTTISVQSIDRFVRSGRRHDDGQNCQVILDPMQPNGLCTANLTKCVEFVVTDSGIGIDPEDLKRIFNRFEQADGSRRKKYKGTGLGLYLCKHIVELHGGSIWAESEGLGKGSTFRFIIPTQKMMKSDL